MNQRSTVDDAASDGAGPVPSLLDAVQRAFSTRFGAPPAWIVRAPGRVNLIGEHTDYNGGFVLPMAIERAAWIALRARDDGQVIVHSLDFAAEVRFDVSHPERGGAAWGEYIKGSASVLGSAGHQLTGWEGVLASDVPIGAGLSSSAAIELATLRAFAAVSALAWQPASMARLAQRAENEWVGVNCGIMDQMISAMGSEGHAVLIDCRSLDVAPVPLPAGLVVVILDTGTRRGLVDSAYNERRRQCEDAASFFGVRALRDVTPEAFAARADALDPVAMRRARHVITENARTLAAADAMRHADALALGQLMNASHDSLRADFEVSSVALDVMVEIARAQAGCHGARMTGAGFGGCAVALVDGSQGARFAREVGATYRHRTSTTPQVYLTGASEGTAIVPSTDW